MLRNIFSIAAIAASAAAFAATPELELPLDASAFQGGWDSQYFEADHTIQFTKAFGGNGWYWYDGSDFSAYDQVVIEYASRGPEVKLAVGYMGTDEMSETRYMPSTYDQLVVDLNPELKNKVMRIVLIGSEAGYVGIRRAYLREKPTVVYGEPVVLFSGAQELNWWDKNVSIYPSALADAKAGDRLTVDYTADGAAPGGKADCIFKLDYRLVINYEFETAPLPGTTASPYFKDGALHMEEYDGEEGSFTHTLTEADIEALHHQNMDCLLITGAHCIINKVALTLLVPAGISEPEMPAVSGEATYYDLCGRRVAHPSAGVYVRRNADGRTEKVYIR